MEILDLDVLAPERRVVKLGGNKIDVSIIPLALTFRITKLTTAMAELDPAKMSEGEDETVQKAFELQTQLCVAFCEHQYPKMTREWFEKNVDARQVAGLASSIKDALVRAYEGIDSKNSQAAALTNHSE